MPFAPASNSQVPHAPFSSRGVPLAGGGSFSWAVGVNAAPRLEPVLNDCVKSLNDCGWDPLVQAEPGTRIPAGTRHVINKKRLGNFHNFRTLCERLLETGADTILTVQDDALFHPDSRIFAESVLWPENAAFLSLYTARPYSFGPGHRLLPPGVRRVEADWLWGNLAVIWPRRVLEAFVSQPWVKHWRGTPGDVKAVANANRGRGRYISPALRRPGVLLRNPGKLNPFPRGSDVACGMIANQLGLGMWFVDPSPVTHNARHSTIAGHGDNSGNRNCFRPADPSRPLKEQVFLSCQEPSEAHNTPDEQGVLP